ncbi:MAG: hypothetical protein C0417_07240 [Chlorobiaceae bacterium]|nr:hypothetical protein [Chlorobiaceae bacterium]
MKLFKRILKWIGISSLIILIIIGLLALFTQTPFFKNRLRTILASTVSTNINGTLHLGTIEGNFLTGFSVASLAIDDQSGTVLRTDKISCSYHLLSLLENKIKIKNIRIENPVIKLFRPVNGDWNISSLIKPSEDTSTTPLAWTIQIDTIKINNSTVYLLDSASLVSPDHWNMPPDYFEYHNFSVRGLTLDMSAIVKQNFYEARIRQINCISPESQFELKKFSGIFIVSDKGVKAEKVKIETGESNFGFTAEMKNINLFKNLELEDLEHDSTKLDFHADNISLVELRSFLPQVNFLDGTTSADLVAKGEFGNLELAEVHIKTMQSEITLAGTIRNLHNPVELLLNVESKNSIVNPPDVSLLLAGLPLPKFGDIEPLNIKLTYNGRPTNFKSTVSLESSVNSATVAGKMNLDANPPEYDFDYTTENIDLGKLFKMENFRTVLNSHGTINGKGFKVEELSASLEATIDSSQIRNIPIDNAHLSIIGSTRNIDGNITISSENSKAFLQGTIDFPPKSLTEYNGTLEVSSFNLAPFIEDNNYQSDLNFKGTINGKGTNIDYLSCNIALSLLPSMFRNHELNSDEISFSLNQNDTLARKLLIKSQIADADIDGNFHLLESVREVVENIVLLIESISDHISTDTIKPMVVKQSKTNKSSPKKAPINFSYDVTLKNLEPVSSLISETPFDARGSIKGMMKSDGRSLSITSHGEVDEFFVGTTKGGVLLHHTNLDAQIDSLQKTNILYNVSGQLSIAIDSGRINTKKISNTKLDFDYQKLKSKIIAQTTIDSIYTCRLQGAISVQPNTYAIDFDSLKLGYGNYQWKNRQDVQLRLNSNEIRIMHAEFFGDKERLKLNGSVNRNDDLNLQASLNNFDLASIAIFFSSDQTLRRPGKGFTGMLNADVSLSGTIDSPIIHASLKTGDITFRKASFGKLNALMDYENENATIDLSIRRNLSSTTPDLRLSGTLPCNLAFKNVEDRFPAKPQDLKLTAEQFDLSLLDPLLYDFDELTGKIRCNIDLQGTPQNPEYKGDISLTDTKFLFNPNNLRYILNSDLEAATDQIRIKSFKVTNVKEKGFVGSADATGYFTIKNFKANYFDFTVKGDFLLMTDATRKISPNIYGILFTETDNSGINLKGSLQRPYLTGKLYIREANLTFPPTKEQESINQNLTLRYRAIDDTTRIPITAAPVSRYFAETDSIDERTNRTVESPILDRLRYNLNVETRGPTALTMIFTPATGEELYAELDGKASVINEQGTTNIYGEIDVSPRSYYNFFKHFDAKGKLKFVGQWYNPELDIQATYEGYKQETIQPTTDQKAIEPATPAGTVQPTEQKVIVTLDISGTRMEPKLAMSMKIQKRPGEDPVDFTSHAKGGDVQSNALAFIITGKFRDELTSRDQQEFTSLGSATGTSVASNLLSSILSDVLKREFPFIRRADVTYRGGSVQEGTSINVTATVGKGSLRLGGTILQDIGNTNVSYQLNVGDLLNIPTIRNLYIEIQRKVEGDNPEDKKLTNEARVFYRFSF